MKMNTGLSLIAFGLLSTAAIRAQEPIGPGLAPVGVRVSGSQASDPRSLIDGRGLAESRPASGVYVHTNNKYADGGTLWNANYGAAQTWLVFDLGKSWLLSGMHVWNGNERGYAARGVQALDVLGSDDGESFAKIGSHKLRRASGRDDYPGEVVTFSAPVKARFVRFEVISNFQPGEPPALSEVRFLSPDVKPPAPRVSVRKYPTPAYPAAKPGARFAGAENIVFPADAGIIDVTKPPYNARGDGTTDDTTAIQQALADHPAQGAIIYLPNGIYLISDTLKWPHGTRGGAEEKDTCLQGQSAAGTILKLRDKCPGFDQPRRPKGLIWTGSAPAQRFANEVRNMTFDTGSGNPGAVGMQFMANNQGCLDGVRVISGDGQGVAGIDLHYTNENGPLLINRVTITGFDYGIWTGSAINSQTLENVTLAHQNIAGLRSDGQTLAIRKLTSTNTVPAIINRGHLALLDSTLSGTGAAAQLAAIVNTGELFARSVQAPGYAKAIDTAGTGDPAKEFTSRPVTTLGGGPAASLSLPIMESPEVPWDEPAQWIAPQKFGAKGDGKNDDTAAIQQAIDAGATTVYFPHGHYRITGTVQVRGKVRRLIGCRAQLVVGEMKEPVFRVIAGDAPVVVFERFASGYTRTVTFENASPRTVVIRHGINVCGTFTGTGDVFLSDVCSNPSTGWRFGAQHVWARQLNVENAGTHIVNDGGQLWILGLKTERTGTLLETRGGGKTELLGGFSYTTEDGRHGPMFTVSDATAFFFFREVCYNGTPFAEIVRILRDGTTSLLRKDDPAYARACLLLRSGP